MTRNRILFGMVWRGETMMSYLMQFSPDFMGANAEPLAGSYLTECQLSIPAVNLHRMTHFAQVLAINQEVRFPLQSKTINYTYVYFF
jgi:hypothetical protein